MTAPEEAEPQVEVETEDERVDRGLLLVMCFALAYGFAAGWAMRSSKVDIGTIRIDSLQRRLDRLEAFEAGRASVKDAQ